MSHSFHRGGSITETERVAKAHAANKYQANFIHNGRLMNRQQGMSNTDQRGLVILTYAKGAPIESQKFFKVVHKPIRSISRIFKKQKDKNEKETYRGVVHKMKCKDCDCV